MNRALWRLRTGVALWAMCSFSVVPLAAQTPDLPQSDPIRIGSKPFAESYLLAELFAQQLEADGISVQRTFGLGATELLFQGLRQGGIDLYPEYTGTGLAAVLGLSFEGERSAVFPLVEREFRTRWGIQWLPPLGFENTYAIAVRQTTADSLGLRTLSDLARVGADLIGGFSPDFLGRADGLTGLQGRYGLQFSETRSLLQAVKYQALAEGSVDVIDGYSTDGAIDRFDLVVLTDDRGFFPPYDAAPLVRADLAVDRPEVVASLVALSGLLTEELVQSANRRMETDGEPVDLVAADLLVSVFGGSGEAAADPVATRRRSLASLPDLFWENRRSVLSQTTRHLFLVLTSLLFATGFAVPLGVLLVRADRWAGPVLAAAGLLQTIPGIALLAFMIPLLGIGVLPALVALFLYSLLPVLRNTWTGVSEADPEAVAAATALGMTEAQVLKQVRLPLAMPVIMAGVRTAAVINVGTATLAAFIGAGGLGDPIVSGLALADPILILTGAIPAALLAIGVDIGLGALERRVTPEGIRPSHTG